MARTSATKRFGEELKRAREGAGLSREEFGKRIGYTANTIGSFETGVRFPQPTVVKGADEHFGTGDRFAILYELLLTTGDVYKDGFRPWAEEEREATSLWTFEALLIPGLLQTEEYACAILSGDEARVAARLARQDILTRAEPPPATLVALLEERVLRTLVGDASVMREQLERLVEAAQRHVVQIVPHGTRTYQHLEGPFTIATVDGRDMVFVDTPAESFVIDSPEVVSRMRRQWDVIRAQALPVQQSIERIQEEAGQWS